MTLLYYFCPLLCRQHTPLFPLLLHARKNSWVTLLYAENSFSRAFYTLPHRWETLRNIRFIKLVSDKGPTWVSTVWNQSREHTSSYSYIIALLHQVFDRSPEGKKIGEHFLSVTQPTMPWNSRLGGMKAATSNKKQLN